MINLLTLRSASPFSEDARYRMLSRLELYGLYEENVAIFEDADVAIDEAIVAVDEGKDIILAIENDDYNDIKRRLIGRLILEEVSSPAIAEAISIQLSSDYNAEPIDMAAHSIIPREGVLLLSNDGLYSGFGYTAPKGNHLFFLPLDYSRIDSVLDELILKYYTNPEPESSASDVTAGSSQSNFDFSQPISNLVYSLVQLDKRVAISESEATRYLKPFSDSVEGFGAVTYFVRDEVRTSNDSEEAQVNTVRRAREALAKTGADFGAAISDLVLTQGEKSNVYSAFIAVADGNTAKIKKIATDKPEDIDLLLPHAVSLLIDTLCQRAEDIANSNLSGVSSDFDDESDKPKAANMSMIIVAVLVAFIAIGSAIFFVVSSLTDDDETTSSSSVSNSLFPIYTTAEPVTQSTSGTPGISGVTDTIVNVDPNYSAPAEPSASQATTQPTAVASSTSGTFTFYVFGYGHGVGLSQSGANYYAKLGWNYAEILANYYYGTTLVIGDTYPDKITYAGAEYNTRDYLATALESEMGSSSPLEALKAQAVALYTYAKYYDFTVSTSGHAYGKTPSTNAYSAVDAVLGYYLTYNGNTALTPFHAMSAGLTTSYYNVWGGTSIPYLSGGRPSYGDYEAKNFSTAYSISSSDFKALVKSRCNIELSGDPAAWLSIISHDACIDSNTGYVYSINVGGTMFSGYKFRSEVMGGTIRSHCFKLAYTPDNA